MHLDVLGGGERGFDEGAEVDVGGEVGEAGGCEGGGEGMGADAAEGRDGDGGCGAVVDY